VPCHAAGAPVRGCGRPDIQGLHDDILNISVVNRPRRARARFVEQPVEAALDKAPNATCHAARAAQRSMPRRSSA